MRQHVTCARFLNLVSEEEDVVRSVSHPRPHLPHDCVLWGRSTHWEPTQDELEDLRLRGCAVDLLSVSDLPIAYILGVHFRSGEWVIRPWRGSVVTCVVRGRSLYARVERFLVVESWFSAPKYPFGNPLVVRVGLDGREIARRYGCIVGIREIDPSRVMVELSEPGDRDFHMMRDSGYDTIRAP